jgi:excisionase family DNA binding protein
MREYTVSEAAELLRVNRVTVWDWINEGKLPARKAGLGKTSPYRISEEDLREAARQLGLNIDNEQVSRQ